MLPRKNWAEEININKEYTSENISPLQAQVVKTSLQNMGKTTPNHIYIWQHTFIFNYPEQKMVLWKKIHTVWR